MNNIQKLIEILQNDARESNIRIDAIYQPIVENPTWLKFEANGTVGSVQLSEWFKHDGFVQAKYSTVHYPSLNVGTGYQVDSISESLQLLPNWADIRNIKYIKKYTSWDDYLKVPSNNIIKYIKVA